MTFLNYAALIFAINQFENTIKELDMNNIQNPYKNKYTNHRSIKTPYKLVFQKNNNSRNRANHNIVQPQWRGYSH